MPDLLTHVLGAYVLLTPLTWHLDRFQHRHVALVMVGTVIPDLAKVRLLIGSGTVSEIVGHPWLWTGIHRFGPASALAGVGAMCFERGRRLPVFGLLVGSVVLHFLFDLTVERAGGVAPPYPYPLSWWHPPAANLLLSSDAWPWMATSVLAAGVWILDRRRRTG